MSKRIRDRVADRVAGCVGHSGCVTYRISDRVLIRVWDRVRDAIWIKIVGETMTITYGDPERSQ